MIELSQSELESILIRHGIIDEDAVHDSEGYDDGETVAGISAACDEINEWLGEKEAK